MPSKYEHIDGSVFFTEADLIKHIRSLDVEGGEELSDEFIFEEAFQLGEFKIEEMKTTIEKNRMLLDFMGERPRMIGPDLYAWSEQPFFYCSYNTPEEVMDAVSEYITYNSDWNRLMQVVGKCLESGDNTDKWDEIFNALSTVSKNTVYEAVVEFVEWYNQNVKS